MNVLVTGAAGFIASRIVQQLLAEGHHVRGTVRSLKKEKELACLRQLPGAAERLDLVEADLLVPGSFDAVAEGREVVLHARDAPRLRRGKKHVCRALHRRIDQIALGVLRVDDVRARGTTTPRRSPSAPRGTSSKTRNRASISSRSTRSSSSARPCPRR